ncbi:MAG: hypothetical protein EA382_00550 [Spirochaetaceae bacterium]|nr:MAG: hypothetical protein EA382_00550 [Spirochaetaceae bacterium]
MQWIDIETELTTAITDLLMAAVALYAIMKILSSRADQRIGQRAIVWSVAFGFLALAGVLGFVAHGFVLSDAAKELIWQPLYLSLGLTMSMFAVGVIIDLANRPAPRGVVVAFVVAGIGFYSLTLFVSGSFLVFILYEAVLLLFALGAYSAILIRRRKRFAAWMLAGIAVSITAAVVQATGTASIQIVWAFDHNGLFHLIQIAGVALLLKGILPGPR